MAQNREHRPMKQWKIIIKNKSLNDSTKTNNDEIAWTPIAETHPKYINGTEMNFYFRIPGCKNIAHGNN